MQTRPTTGFGTCGVFFAKVEISNIFLNLGVHTLPTTLVFSHKLLQTACNLSGGHEPTDDLSRKKEGKRKEQNSRKKEKEEQGGNRKDWSREL